MSWPNALNAATSRHPFRPAHTVVNKIVFVKNFYRLIKNDRARRTEHPPRSAKSQLPHSPNSAAFLCVLCGVKPFPKPSTTKRNRPAQEPLAIFAVKLFSRPITFRALYRKIARTLTLTPTNLPHFRCEIYKPVTRLARKHPILVPWIPLYRNSAAKRANYNRPKRGFGGTHA